MQKPRTAVLAAFVLVSILLRLTPYFLGRFFGMATDPENTIYPWNFSPFIPICLFAAAYMPRQSNVFLMMLGALLIGDVGIGLLIKNMDFAFYGLQQFVVYFAFSVSIAIGFFLRKYKSWPAIAGTGLLASTAFFIVSNFGVWALGNGTDFAHTWGGLLKCYTFAVPFFRNTLISMAIFLPVLFSRISLTVTAPEPVASLAPDAG